MPRAKLLGADRAENIRLASETLAKGGLVAFPTETVYGLGADALNPEAVCRIFEVKKRPSFDPLIVHVASPAAARKLWKEVPRAAERLMEKFWPGPLTLVLPKSPSVPDVVTSGLPTVGVRVPSHPDAQLLLAEFGRPVAAPSANIFGYTSPTSAAAVMEDLGDAIDIVLEGRRPSVGVESTVLSIEGEIGTLLRPGGLPVEELERFLKVIPAAEGSPGSPGRLEMHYAPWTPLVLNDPPHAALVNSRGAKNAGLLAFRAASPGFSATEVLSVKGDLYEAASNLFEAIRKLDKMQLDLIVAERVPRTGIGLAIMDRLEKASKRKDTK